MMCGGLCGSGASVVRRASGSLQTCIVDNVDRGQEANDGSSLSFLFGGCERCLVMYLRGGEVIVCDCEQRC